MSPVPQTPWNDVADGLRRRGYFAIPEARTIIVYDRAWRSQILRLDLRFQGWSPRLVRAPYGRIRGFFAHLRFWYWGLFRGD